MTRDADLSLLYVDDDPELRAVVVRSLRLDRGISVRIAESGACALEILADADSHVDLVLLDVMMPDLDGPGVLEEMRRIHGSDIPVIFFTARAQTSEVRALAGQGVIGVLTKPFDPLTLASQIRQMYEAAQPTSL